MGDEGIVLLAKDGSLVRHYLRALSKSKGAVFGAAVIAILTVVAVLAPFLAPYHPNHMTPAKRLQPPSPAHYFGTDGFGRDVFSRVFYGTRVSLGVGVCCHNYHR